VTSLLCTYSSSIAQVQDGLGRKLGDVVQYCTQFLFAFAVAFYYNWQLTLVLLSAFPFIALSGTSASSLCPFQIRSAGRTHLLCFYGDILCAGAVLISAVSAVTTLSLEQYALAGSIATETLAGIRTVSALNAQPDAIKRYRVHLFAALQVTASVITALVIQTGLGIHTIKCSRLFLSLLSILVLIACFDLIHVMYRSGCERGCRWVSAAACCTAACS
jgi:ATP-binding cassette subfamily B (MDR/TAP) protein 1